MEIISARDLSKYLKINEKKIYKLVQESKLPHIKIGGKIAFTKETIDKWILESTAREENIFIAGSDDILLRRIIDVYNSKNSSTIYYAPVGSINGLKALKKGAATMSCVHILDIEKKEYNTSYVERYLSGDDYIVIQMFFREQGLYLPKNNSKQINSIEDIAAKGATFINRNQGSGTRLLFDFLLREKKIDHSDIKGYNNEVESHLQAGLNIVKGNADVTFGVIHLAHMLGINFVPIFKERFDMVIPKEHFHSTYVKSFLAFFEQPVLLTHIKDFTGYDASGIGSVLYPNA